MIIASISAFALGIQLELNGYLRTRFKLLNNITATQVQGLTPLITYFDSRGLLNATVGNENLKLKTRVDLIDNTVWGYNTRGVADAPLAQFVSFHDVIGKEVQPVKIRRLWLESMTPVGLFMIGIMPSQWGLGMAVNSGDNIYDDFGDTYARVLFATKPLGKESDLITAVFYDKVVEGAVLREGSSDLLDADVDDFGAVILYSGTTFKGGTYLLTRIQSTTGSQAFAPSIYSEYKSRFYFGGEVAGMFGQFSPFKGHKIDISSLGAVIRVGYESDNIFPIFEFGYTSPQSDDEFDSEINRLGTKVNSYAFHPNYRPSLLLFQFVGGKKFSGLNQKGFSNVLESRRVWNSFYLKLSSQIKTELIVIIPSVISAWDSEKSKFLGLEPNIEVRNYLLKERENNQEHSLFLSAKVGYLIVGDRLIELERFGEKFTKKANVFGLIGYVAYEF